jgi:HD superfamily phosphohydrolase
MAQKLFRDPLYDYIAIDNKKYPWLLKLIDCPEVQRLRYINQLGLGQLTYPGSTHTRFSHSLGVMHLTQQCISHLELSFPEHAKNLDKEALLAASLLHDIGHGPLSHATEKIFGDHERRTAAIIQTKGTEVNKALRSYAEDLPSRVIGFIQKKSESPLWQKSLISSQLDVDRLDYLRRDSLCSGAEYGHFDWFRIINTMELKEKKIEASHRDIFVVWPDKSKYAIEEYIFSRFYMYQSVYFHYTTRGYEGLIRSILTRARDIALNDSDFLKNLLPPMQMIVDSEQTVDTCIFLKLTDHTLFAQIALWQNEKKDEVLTDLAQRLMLRKGVGWIKFPPTHGGMKMHEKISDVEDYLKKQSLDHKYYFFEDKPGAPAYKPYRPAEEVEDQSSVNSIILYDPSWGGTHFKEVSDVPGLERLKAITGKEQHGEVRYYFPKEHEKKIKSILGST